MKWGVGYSATGAALRENLLIASPANEYRPNCPTAMSTLSVTGVPCGMMSARTNNERRI